MSVQGSCDDLTVVIPVWDSYVRFLPALLDQLAGEGVAPERILVVDNASTVPVHTGRARHLRLTERVSVGAARNAGLAEVRTPAVTFCDADDDLISGTLAQLTSLLLADPKRVLAAGRPVLPDGSEYNWPPRWAFRSLPRPVRAAAQWGWNQLPMATGAVLRTDTVRRMGGFPDFDLAEDGMLGCLLVCAGECVLVDQPSRVYRTHPDGLCQRGHSRARWRAAYRQQRHLIVSHPELGPTRQLAHMYAPVHWWLARRLARVARHTS